MNIIDVEQLQIIAEVEFVDIVTYATVPDLNELRIISMIAVLWMSGFLLN